MIAKKDFLLSSYNYSLKKELIAQKPSNPQHKAKLLVCTKSKDWYSYIDKKISDLPNILNKNTVLFFNDTKVYKARLRIKNKKSIRKTWKEHIIKDWEILIYKIIDNHHFEWISSDDKNFKPGSDIFRNKSIKISSKELSSDWIIFQIHGQDIYKFLSKEWESPLPPYIKYDKSKEKRYQTNFAKNSWSAAAPTASLHFTKTLLNKLKRSWIKKEFNTLHIWLGTFKPIFEENIKNHKIHSEEIIIKKSTFDKIAKYKKGNKKIISVWTTSVRLLETLPYLRKLIDSNIFTKNTKEYRNKIAKSIKTKEAEKIISNINMENDYYKLQTKLFIIPWFTFKISEIVITNFHLPKSSLIIMISAFMWRKETIKAYNYAQSKLYKFYSFWDAMIIINNKEP